jgi:putative polyketide hydroxylase
MNTAVAEGHDLGWKLAWVHRGWAGPELLDSYEAEWRPVGARRATRSAVDGPEQDGPEALAEDLNDRLAHAWLRRGHRRVSTLDLLGPGLTVFTGPDGHAWAGAAAATGTPFPLEVHALDGPAADLLGVGADGAVLVRPDARVLAHWPTAGDPRADLAAAVGPRWFEPDLAAAASA